MCCPTGDMGSGRWVAAGASAVKWQVVGDVVGQAEQMTGRVAHDAPSFCRRLDGLLDRAQALRRLDRGLQVVDRQVEMVCLGTAASGQVGAV